MLNRLLVALLLVLLGLPPAQAQEQESSAVAASVIEEVLSITQEGNVSLNFRDVDIRNVLKSLSLKSGVNVVVAPDVAGVITIELTDVPWEQALEVILDTYGYAYEKKGNIITVTTIERMKQRREDELVLAEQEPLQMETFALKFSKASEVVASIDPIKSDRGIVNFDERTNIIIVRDISKNIQSISGVISKLDRPTEQVQIEAKIVETTFVDTENLGVDWLTKATISGAERPIIWPFTSATDDKYAPDAFPGADTTAGSANAEFSYGTLNFSQVQAVFELLKTRSDTNILSSPRIVTLDHQPASIDVGSQYPIPTYTYNEEQARLQISGWEYMDIGIKFNVTPHVNQDVGYVTMDIEPQITAILDFVTVENTTLPRLSNENAKTTVMIKDGETLVIAGLVKDQTTDVKKKTPFLADIPILGLLFKKSNESITKTDLLIFMTPHIITPEV